MVKPVFKVIAAIAVFALCADAHAAYMDCLETSKGLVVSWNAAWTDPNSDQDVEYRIQSVRIKNVMPERSVTLELASDGMAKQKRRTLVVSTEEKARSVCERISEISRPLSLPGERSSRFEIAMSSGDLPYIQYSLQEGWVRGKPPRNKKLTTCRIQELEFSCLEEDKERYGSVLVLVEEELRTGIR